MSKYRVLFTIPNFKTAGSGQVLLNLLRSFNRDKSELYVCVLQSGGLDEEVKRLNIPVLVQPFTVSIRPRSRLLFRAWQAAHTFKTLSIDIWHSWHYLDDYSEPLVARLAGVKKWGYTKKNMSWGSNGWRLRSWIAHYIVADNPQMLDRFFASRTLRNKTRVITHGIDIDKFRPLVTNNNLRQSLNIPQNAALIGCIGTLIPLKEQATLIKSIHACRTKPYLVLIGDGDEAYKVELNKLITDLKLQEQVFFLGRRANDELPVLLNELDVVALTSRSEALGVVLLEAMACAIPCVATRCGGPEQVIDDGENGLLVPVGDVFAIAKAIDHLLDDTPLRKRMGQLARQKIEQHFDYRVEARQYEKVFESLLSS